ncbi:hypothetical protein AUJ17_04820 [Candidatus Micrarchaeota archaeon CG1_02_47_40]|nr:MAG: hypothetical protein AUJ17_04820 [Candidatus Micrarchaeota archaeon CG1_02_47_40]
MVFEGLELGLGALGALASLVMLWKFRELLNVCAKRKFLKNSAKLLAIAFLVFFAFSLIEELNLLSENSRVVVLLGNLIFIAVIYLAVSTMKNTVLSQKYTVEEKKLGRAKFE